MSLRGKNPLPPRSGRCFAWPSGRVGLSRKRVQRCQAQIDDVLGVLEAERAKVATPYCSGCASATPTSRSPASSASPAKHIRSCSMPRYPALAAHAARCEALASFREIVQPLAPPKG